MSTLANGTEPLVDPVHHGHYAMDSGTMMYPNNHTEVNQTTEGFLSAILNDEDLQLMDMAMNEGDPSLPLTVSRRNSEGEHMPDAQPVHVGMYTMRMLDNEDAMDTSSDSAVSSMGSSERVPSISDGVSFSKNCVGRMSSRINFETLVILVSSIGVDGNRFGIVTS